MKDYLELYFSEFLIIISIINLVLLGYLVFYLKKHKKLHIPHKEQPYKEQPTPFTPHKKEAENRMEEKEEKKIEKEERIIKKEERKIEKEKADNSSLPNKKKENYMELLRPELRNGWRARLTCANSSPLKNWLPSYIRTKPICLRSSETNTA